MKKGHLSQYFKSVAAKRLSAVEADTEKSHQHEFNGTTELKKVLGTGTGEKISIPAQFLWIGKENEALSSEGIVTWYDARLNHATRSEYRLYFPTTEVSELSRQGDLMIIASKTDGTLMIIIASSESTIENQLIWLFDIQLEEDESFTSSEIDSKTDREIDFVVRIILEELGIEVEEPEAPMLDKLLSVFKGVFPSTTEFSLFARSTLKDVSPIEEPDKTLMLWMNQEEKLFRRLERQIVASRLGSGFFNDGVSDVDGFIKYSLSVQNRRKSRAGYALENHLEEMFRIHKVLYNRFAITENNSKPDFIFPGIAEYNNAVFPAERLTMLGVKTSCKDRWRQVLVEAERIDRKHLFTLEPGISENQMNEMHSKNLQLVIPEPIHSTFNESQISWLINLEEFLTLVKERQKI